MSRFRVQAHRATKILKNAQETQGRGTGRLAQLRDTAIAAQSLYELGKQLVENLKDRVEETQYTVTVEEDNELFPLVQSYLYRTVPARRMHDVQVGARQMGRSSSFQDNPLAWSVWVENTASDAQHLTMDGHRIRVEYREPEYGGGEGVEGGGRMPHKTSQARLVFTCRDYAAREAVIALTRSLVDELNSQNQPPSRVFVASSWGSWDRMQGVSRPIETVVLRDGLKEQLIDDLRRFLTLEERYAKLGIPWHRGYLLHGPPGTGKTSLVKAVASFLQLDLYYASLSDLNSDNDIANMISRLGPRSILLLEDIDAVEAVQERKKGKRKGGGGGKRKGVTMSGILNNLDGVATPSGLIVMMSTNHRDLLDPALLRKGRVDYEVEVGNLEGVQFRRLLEVLLNEVVEAPPDLESLQIPPSDVVEVIKLHLDESDPQIAAKAVLELVEQRREETRDEVSET